jgi:phospholipid/cholesterol/gamma-HCH transport system ATP-binding protein
LTRGTGDGERDAVIELRSVDLAFDDMVVLDDVSLRVRRGETMAVLGGSGAGKSTLLRLVLGLSPPDAGEILVLGRDMVGASRDEALEIRQNMGMVFQAAALFDSLTVEDNVAFFLREHTERSEEEILARVREVLEMVDLDPAQVTDLLPAELSGGMRKRVGIARALVHSPSILLYDEPTSGLDPITTRTIDELVLKLQRELEVTTVVVTHDVASAFRIADRLALLSSGRIVFLGTPEEMRQSEDEYVAEFLR